MVTEALKGDRHAATAVCERLAAAFGSRAVPYHDFHRLVLTLFKVQPMAALDAFLRPSEHLSGHSTILAMFNDVPYFPRHPIMEVAEDTVLGWCAKDPGRNFPAAATSVPYSRAVSDGTGLGWSDLALRMLERAPEPLRVMKSFIDRFAPHSWSGSRASIIETNAKLLTAFEQSGDKELARFSHVELKRLLDYARREREWEIEISRDSDQCFE